MLFFAHEPNKAGRCSLVIPRPTVSSCRIPQQLSRDTSAEEPCHHIRILSLITIVP
jgi:hypothetical protein